MLRLFCFISFSFFFAFVEDAALRPIVLLFSFFVQSFFDMHAPRQPHAASYLKPFCVIFLFFSSSLEMSVFPSNFLPLQFPLCIALTSYVSPLPDGVFLPYDHGLDFLIILCESSIKINQSLGSLRTYESVQDETPCPYIAQCQNSSLVL